MKLLDAIGAVFRGLLRPSLRARILAGIEAAAPYLEAAYELVALAAVLTPTRADDEIVALAERLNVPDVWRSGDPEAALREIVAAALRQRWPDLPNRTAYRAVEIAYGAVRP